MSITVGNITAISRPTAIEVSRTSSLACPKRSSSRASRTNARITRMPAICSRRVRFTASRRACICRNSGRMRRISRPMKSISTGATATSSSESGPSWRMASSTPPTSVIGAATTSVKVMSASVCTCCTSLVVRVISEGAPEGRHLAGRERLDLLEERAAHVAADDHRRACAVVDGAGRAGDLQERDGEHHAAGADDVGGVAGDDAAIDDVGVERRQVERGRRLDQLQQSSSWSWRR